MEFVRKSLPLVLGGLFWGAMLALVWAQAVKAPSTGIERPEAAIQPEARAARAVSRGPVLVASLTVFVLAVFVGFEVIGKVPPTLHTPLMSGSNAISGITVVGAILAAGHMDFGFAALLGAVATIMAFVNVVGGYLVTHRMLKMFQKR